MSDKERAIQLLEEIPENKMNYVVNMLVNIRNLLMEEEDPDEWDLRMIAEAAQENDGTAVSLEEMLKRDGLTYADLQN